MLVGVLLFYPLVDRDWRPPIVKPARTDIALWAGIFAAALSVLALYPQHLEFALSTLLLAALPEEWFFRAYFMTRLGTGVRANLLASLLFAALHGLTRGWVVALLVFIPSLFYGWLYQRRRDLVLVILAHALSNIIYVAFISEHLQSWIATLFYRD